MSTPPADTLEPGDRGPSLATRIAVPVALGAAMLGLWEFLVWHWQIPKFVLPAPSMIADSFLQDYPTLFASLWITFEITVAAFLIALVAGVALATLFAQSELVEMSLFPYAVILQVTPVIAIAPLLLIYLDQDTAVVVCAFIVAFFPVLSNTTLGLNSVDRNLAGLFQLYGASKSQALRFLKLPSALPYILGGLRIAGGLSLIGAVVAEIAAGTAGAGSGLAYRIAESGYRLNIPRMFAALLLLSLAGIVIYGLLALISHLVLRRWHESALGKEN
jgi:NitT/TauT family transport system permease protein